MKNPRGIIGLFIILHLLPGNKLLAQNILEQESGNTTLRMMTYNLKFASSTFEPSWEVRREMQVDMIRRYDPDII